MACIKKTYGTKGAAERRAANLEIEEGKKLWVYQCRTCFKWHLTSKKPAKRSYKQKRDGRRVRK